MNYIATITSKRQLTIPVALFSALKLKKGEKVLVSQEDHSLKISPVVHLVRSLAGSVKIPRRFQNMTIQEIVSKAKKEHFHNDLR